jgi:non-specific serine/threonine protein kinase
VDEAIAEALAPWEPSLTPGLTKPGAASSILTQREREVAASIRRGQTNRQIAGELSITEGTVANHVVHILGKLGYNSRTQVAVWVADNGLLAPQRSN